MYTYVYAHGVLSPAYLRVSGAKAFALAPDPQRQVQMPDKYLTTQFWMVYFILFYS